MLVNKSTISSVFLNLKTIFNNAFEDYKPEWPKTAMLSPSNTSQEDYVWLSKFPVMREWLGDKQVSALKAFSYSVVNQDWEATVEVDRNDVEDERLSIYRPQAEMAAFSASHLGDDLIDALKNGGFATAGPDGQYFYDTDHPVGQETITDTSNLGTAALSVATLAGAIASIGVGITAMMSLVSDEGRQLRIVPDVLEVGPTLAPTAKIMVSSDKFADESPNPYNGTLKLMVNPGITSATAWFLHCTKFPYKPFIYQERKKPTFVQQIKADSDDVFMRKMFKFGAEARAAAGYGLWQLSYASTGAA